ncbi:hypothetical protein IMZ48_09965 [Candidatus Bathyarchaeota archaeon]|nr:hypothetical protein [Candidatus Bathyarchaeota archaeon]
MRYLFTEAPWFVPTMDSSRFAIEIDRRVENKEQKRDIVYDQEHKSIA